MLCWTNRSSDTWFWTGNYFSDVLLLSSLLLFFVCQFDTDSSYLKEGCTVEKNASVKNDQLASLCSIILAIKAQLSVGDAHPG